MASEGSKPDNKDAPPEQTSVTATASPVSYTRYRFVSDIVSSLTSLIVGLAWPVLVLIIIVYIANHGTGLVTGTQSLVQGIMKGNQKVELQANSSGFHMIFVAQVAQEVQKGLTQQVTTTAGGNAPKGPEVTGIQQVAAQAASQLSSPTADRALVTKVLWVDDHPENNVGLSYAFQALGMIVVCVDSNVGIADAFAASGSFDVVITDMYRDAVGNKPAQPEGGWETVNLVKARSASARVIIYAGSYAASHANDKLEPPVVAITNDPRVVLRRVTDMAEAKKGRDVAGTP